MADFASTFTALAKGVKWGASFDAMLLELEAQVNALAGGAVTSATSITPGAGSHAFTTDQTATAVPLSGTVRARSAADPAKFIVGTVASFTGTTLTLTAIYWGGSGAVTDWVISADVVTSSALAGNATGAIDMNGNALTVDALNLSGVVAGNDQQVVRVELKDFSETVVTADTGTAYTVDLEAGNVLDLTLTGNVTYTFSNPPASGKGGAFTLIQTQDGTGSRSVTWPGSVEWAGGEAPTVTATAGATDVFTFVTVDGGTTWRGFAAGQEFG